MERQLQPLMVRLIKLVLPGPSSCLVGRGKGVKTKLFLFFFFSFSLLLTLEDLLLVLPTVLAVTVMGQIVRHDLGTKVILTSCAGVLQVSLCHAFTRECINFTCTYSDLMN
jgi:hypothetical protein